MSKESFLIYKSFYEPIKFLSDAQLGQLFRALFLYQIEGNTQVSTDIQMAFAFFKNQMDIDEMKYQRVVERNKVNGAKGGRPSKNSNPENPVGYKKPKKADNDNDNDNGNVNDNENGNEKENDIINIKQKIDADINEVYSAYPTKCVVNGRSTSKSTKDKNKIKSMLKHNSKDELLYAIKRYVTECRSTSTYMKNFSTFLNNLPDYSNDDYNTITNPAEPELPANNGGFRDFRQIKNYQT